MTFNLWHGGTQVDFGGVIAAVRAAGADVVGLQEAEGNTRRLAESLGWKYADERHQIVSRLPLIDPPGGDGVYLFLEPEPGRVVAIANVHLTSDPYGPDAVRDGATLDSVAALERSLRLPEIRRHLELLPRLAAGGIPVFLTGDFNSPSHLDWTAKAMQTRPQVRFAFAWPVTVAVERAGLRDSYRAIHPDPVLRPGLTWTPGYPPPNRSPRETLDRIDLIYSAGDVQPLQSRIVGEPSGPDVDVAVTPWPSDHRAVVSTFRVTPARMPVLVGVGRRAVRVGDSIEVRYHAPGTTARLALSSTGGPVAGEAIPVPGDGVRRLPTVSLPPGEYQAVLLDELDRPLARAPFTLLARDAVPEVAVDGHVTTGEPIAVRWRHAPGNRWDWIGVFRAGEKDLEQSLAWRHTGATISGALALGPDAFEPRLPPGHYEVRLLEDDGYETLATARFVVVNRR